MTQQQAANYNWLSVLLQLLPLKAHSLHGGLRMHLFFHFHHLSKLTPYTVDYVCIYFFTFITRGRSVRHPCRGTSSTV
jgi:hypothetical protein